MIDDVPLIAETIGDLVHTFKRILLLEIGLFCMTKRGQGVPFLLFLLRCNMLQYYTNPSSYRPKPESEGEKTSPSLSQKTVSRRLPASRDRVSPAADFAYKAPTMVS